MSHEQPQVTTRQDTFNYFNYFTEVEEEFVRRRGKPMFISPMDWALVESWKNAGIPLHIVIRAIHESFDAYDARTRKYRKVNSIFYCQQTVETMFAEYRQSQVGAPSKDATTDTEPKQAPPTLHTSAFSKEVLQEFLQRSEHELEAAETFAREQQRQPVEDALQRARRRLQDLLKAIDSAREVNDEHLEHDLDGIDRMILKAIHAALSKEDLQQLREDAEGQLKSYKKKMDKKIYERTVENFTARRLREIHRIPRLSLFYI